VPRATKPAALDAALAEGSALMGTAIVEGSVFPVEVGERQDSSANSDRHDATLRQFVGSGNAVPLCTHVPPVRAFARLDLNLDPNRDLACGESGVKELVVFTEHFQKTPEAGDGIVDFQEFLTVPGADRRSGSTSLVGSGV